MKSCVLLAGPVRATGRRPVVEPLPTRDHTERMLDAAGVRVTRQQRRVSVWPVERLAPRRGRRPGRLLLGRAVRRRRDAAARVASCTIHDVGLNPRRIGLLDVLERMGARITIFNRRRSGGEPVGDLEVRSAELTATAVDRRGGAAAGRRAAALRARGRAGAWREHRPRRRGAAREGDGPHRDRDDFAPRPRRARHRARRRLRGQRRARPAQGRAAWPRTATIGSRCSARSQGSSRATESSVEDAEAVAVSFPGFFELLDSVTQR